jgi:hypothetical protein
MSDFSVRSDSVDVEQIMRQIRARIRDKRGVDYTEDQIRELANAKLERFLDPSGVRSGLFEEFRRQPPPATYAFEDTTLFDSDKPLIRFFRKLLRPFLKLMFNPNVLSSTLHNQAEFNDYVKGLHPLYFELMHNLVLETTRLAIETKNLKMRVESLQSRLEFNERRSRALEGVVQYKPEALHRPSPEARAADGKTEPQGGVDPVTGGESLRTRRRRRRRGRRGQAGQAFPGAPDPSAAPTGDEGPDEGDGPDNGEPGGDWQSGPAAEAGPARETASGSPAPDGGDDSGGGSAPPDAQ